MKLLIRLPKELVYRYGAVLFELGKKRTVAVLRELKLDNNTIDNTGRLVDMHGMEITEDKPLIRHQASSCGAAMYEMVLRFEYEFYMAADDRDKAMPARGNCLRAYCTGSLNLFNHPTNVKTDSRVVCIVLKNMGENLRKIAMHITNEFVSQAVDQNFHEGAATWCYFDEFHILLRDPLTASYFVAVWKMLRKKGCVPSALTQNVKDLLASREIENILDNTDFLVLLSQAQSDRAIIAKQLGISEHQLSYITHSNSGEGLLFYGNVTIPFVDRFPKGEIYNLLTTRPEDMAHERKDE